MKKKTRIIIDCLLIILGIIFLVFGIKDAIKMYNDSKIGDNITFSRNYSSVSEDNIFKYISLKDLDSLLEDGTGIILIGSKTDPWNQVLVNPLQSIVKEYVNDIYFLELDDIKEDKYYDSIIKQLDSLSSPTILIIKDGTILTRLDKVDLIEGYYDGSPIEYFDEKQILELNNKLSKIRELR